MSDVFEICSVCGHRVRQWEHRDTTGASHRMCVEAGRADVGTGSRLSPIRRFFRHWWGAGHH